MSQNKLHALGNILAGVFREPPISTKTEPAPTTSFDQPTNEEPADQDKLQALDSTLTEVLREKQTNRVDVSVYSVVRLTGGET